jgi:hypothetical protein
MPNFGLPSARAEASRKKGAKSRGPKTAEGKARSPQNALKHGLCARRFAVLGDEDLAAFDALEAALTAELAPGRAAGGARAPDRRRHLAARAGRVLGRRNGVGAPFPNPTAKRPSCSRRTSRAPPASVWP